jgi:hypothetical protein
VTSSVGTPSDLLHLRSIGLRLVFAAILGTQLVLALVSIDGVTSPWPVIAALVAFSGGLVLVAMPHPEPFPRLWVAGVCVSVVLTNVLVLWNLPAGGRPPYSDWCFGAAAWLGFFLAFRGRIAGAWVSWALMALVTQLWSVSIGEVPLESFNHVVRHAGTILIAVLFRIMLVRASRTIVALHEERLLKASAEASAVGEIRERQRQAARLGEEARPALQQIAVGDYLTPDRQQRFRLLEANLRDALRGGELISREVANAVEQARRRGAEVVLLDDRNTPLTEPDAIRLEAVLLGELTELSHGRLTARLLPAGRHTIASVVIASEGSRRRIDLAEEDLEVSPDAPPVRVPSELI